MKLVSLIYFNMRAVDSLRESSFEQNLLHQLISLTGDLLERGDHYMTQSDKLVDLLDQRKEIVDVPDAEELYECVGEIEFQNGKCSSCRTRCRF